LGDANLLEPPDLCEFLTTISHLLCYGDFGERHDLAPFVQKLGAYAYLILSENFDIFVKFLIFSKNTIFFLKFTLQKLTTQTNHVVTRLSGDGAVDVLCMLRINFDRPNFHSMSD
jgi:hypothetical protein